MAIHLGKRPSAEGWTSFETDSHLRETRQRIYGRCFPCLSGLLRQLEAGSREITLDQAWNCWKVVAVVQNREQCLEVLQKFEELYPREKVRGKFGGGGAGRPGQAGQEGQTGQEGQASQGGRASQAVMFHTDDELNRDDLLGKMAHCARMVVPGAKVFYSRGCANPYELVLGPWQDWDLVSVVKYTERLPQVIEGLRKSLYQR